MLFFFNGSSDITQYVEYKTYSDDEALNNRRKTASFVSNLSKVDYGQTVYVYESFKLRAAAASGQKILKVDDTFEDTDKFRTGETIIVGAKTAHEKKYVIDTIDHSAREVHLTENLTNTIALTECVGRLRYAGTCVKSSETEIGTLSGVYGYKVQLTDWSGVFDRKTVADTFTDQWSREITGRIVYKACANDDELNVDLFESAWTQSGVALAMANETTDKIQGTNAQKTGTSGAGTATWSKTISSIDISDFTHVRFWWKIGLGYGSLVTAFKIRIGTDASNYYEWNIANIGEDFEDCWNYESIILSNPTASLGSPDLSAVTYLAIRMTAIGAVPTGNLIFDHMLASTGGFTIQNVQRGVSKFANYQSNYKKPTVIVEDIMKSQVMLWDIDVERDIHQYSSSTTAAPFDIDNSSTNYSNLVITPDITKLVNRQMVRGGEAPDQTLLTEEKVADGVQKTFQLAYKPKELQVWVANWNGASYDAYAQKTVGVENLVDESTVDFVFSFQEKVVRNASFATLDALDKIKFIYYPYKPIRKRVQNNASIAAMQALTGGDGIFDGMPIVDTNINTFDDAQLRAQAELDLYSNPLYTATFDTEYDGLHAGQYIHITDVNRGIDQDFLIQQVKAKQKSPERFLYSITAGTSLYGIIEMLQYLLKKSTDITIDSNEIIDIVLNQDETITIEDDFVFTHKSKIATAASRYVKKFDFVAEAGSVTSDGEIFDTSTLYPNTKKLTWWYGEFSGSETGTIQFASSNYNTGRELRITTAVGGTGKEAKARSTVRIPVAAGVSHTVKAYLQILAALTNQGAGAGAKLVVKEYATASSSSVLATNTVFTAKTAVQDFNDYSVTFTTNASTGFITLEFSLVAAIGTVSISGIVIQSNAAESQTVPVVASFSQAS